MEEKARFADDVTALENRKSERCGIDGSRSGLLGLGCGRRIFGAVVVLGVDVGVGRDGVGRCVVVVVTGLFGRAVVVVVDVLLVVVVDLREGRLVVVVGVVVVVVVVLRGLETMLFSLRPIWIS